MAETYNNSIFWVDVGKIDPNPYQPRKEFDEGRLNDLADSIRQYGVLQPLVVTSKEAEKEEGGIAVSYELIAGERRLRAAKIAGVLQVPVIIRVGDENNLKLKLEIAIIENVQREDLNPIDRAHAFRQLVDEFGFKHHEVALKISKSREYVSNSVRLLSLPEEIVKALSLGTITEGHARPLLMLMDRPDEQRTLYKEIVYKKLTVREAERIARHTAQDRVRKKSAELDPTLLELEEELSKTLGTRVQVESKGEGGKIMIDFFSPDDLANLIHRIMSKDENTDDQSAENGNGANGVEELKKEETGGGDDDSLYAIKNFTI